MHKQGTSYKTNVVVEWVDTSTPSTSLPWLKQQFVSKSELVPAYLVCQVFLESVGQ